MRTEAKKAVLWTGDNPLKLESGDSLGPVEVVYETYGTLNEDRLNAILILHAFSGSAYAAGHKKEEDKPGWWDSMIGAKKAFDTDKYFIICSNVLGGCAGTTGPLSQNPSTGRPYGLDLPSITINDMVRVQKRLVDNLGIKRLLSVAGGSMGGMQALAWMADHPDSINSAIVIAASHKHSPQQIAFHEVGRQAIMADPDWMEGDYYGKSIPAKGLALARMIGHITYMSEQSMEEKFGRQTKQAGDKFKFTADFEVEHYLRYKGDSFVKRFDANSYLYLTKAMDRFDASGGKPLENALKGHKYKALVISFNSDWLYPSGHSKEIVKACKKAGVDATYCELDSKYGHDAFLLETKEQSHLIKHFLEKVRKDI